MSMSSRNLQLARSLALPTRDQMLRRDPSVRRFWLDNRGTLESAWREWEALEGSELPPLDESLVSAELRAAVDAAWKDSSKEDAVRRLWKETVPGVYECQFFDPEKLVRIRRFFDAASEARIPARPPYGIVLNRRGFMLDSRSEAYLAAPSFQQLYKTLIERYMRPVARLLFPDVYGHDTQSFGFSIMWETGADTSIRQHSDASSVTLNINLNIPGEEYSGSGLYFVDPASGRKHDVFFKPGVAVIHHGAIQHAALPITSGTRSNIVLWLYGDQGSAPSYYEAGKELTPEQRWSVPSAPKTDYAPF